MGIVGDQRAAGCAAAAGQRPGVAAGAGRDAEQALQPAGPCNGAEAEGGIAADLREPLPQLRPVLTLAQLEQAEIGQPVDIGAGDAPDGQHVPRRPRFALEAEQMKLVRQLFDRALVMVYTLDKPVYPSTGVGRHFCQCPLGAAAEVQNAQGMVDIDGERPGHFGDPAGRDAP